MTDETRPTTQLPRQVYDSDGDPMVWMDHDVAMPAPDTSDYAMTTIREGAPRRALMLESPGEGLEAWQEESRPKSSKAEIVLLVMLILIMLAEAAQWAYLLLVIGDGW